MPNRMIMDKIMDKKSEKSANGETNAWTKLLTEQEKPSKQPVIVKMTANNIKNSSSNNNNNNDNSNVNSNVNSKEEQLTVTDSRVQSDGVAATISAVDVAASVEPAAIAYNRSATYGSGINSTGGESSGSGTLLSRKESFLGTFHRQLRRSIKAVSESPGPLTR